MKCKFIKKFNFLIVFIISFILLLSFNVFAETFICRYCGKTFSYQSDLDNHYAYGGCTSELEKQDKEQKFYFAGVAFERSDGFSDKYTDYELLENNYLFYSWMKFIFSLDNFESQEVDLFNIKTTMGAITEALLNGINEWGNSPLYSLFVGIGVFLLFVSFIMSFYTNTINNENKTLEQFSRMLLQLIIAIFIVANVKNIANIIVSIFIFTANQAWSLVKDGNGGEFEEQIVQVTLKILKEAGLDDRDILNQVFNMLKSAILHIHYLLPWIASIIGKFGIVFAVVKADFNIFVNIMLYPIASFDCFDNIKHSNFMKYTKKIASSSLRLTIIVLVIYANNLLLSNYMKDMLTNLDQHNNIFNLAVMSVVFQLVKMTMATSVADSISREVFGG